MARSKSTETIRFDHLSCEDDAIGVTFYKTKTKQEGTTIRDPKHCYANPLKPAVCLFLALGVYLTCNSTIKPGCLFPGSKQKERFGKSLGRLLSTDLGSANEEKPNRKSEFGTHSIRKGVATFATSGSTGGPSIVSICLRCGWSLGNVMERYFRYEAAGDQCTGRVVAGLPVNSNDFCVLPPHFRNTDDPKLDDIIALVFPQLHELTHLSGVWRLLLASLVYHFDYLVAELPSSHSLLQTVLFSNPDMIFYLRSILVVGHESPVMRASGVPPHVYMYQKLETILSSVCSIPAQVHGDIAMLLEQNGIAAGNITRSFLESTIASAVSRIAELNRPQQIQADVNSSCRPNYSNFDGPASKLPASFSFPSVNVAAAWRLWWLGNPVQNIVPYSQIMARDLPTRTLKNTLSEWKYLMNEKLLPELQRCGGAPLTSKSTEADVINAFDMVKHILDPVSNNTAKKRQRRDGQMKVCTVVKNFRLLEGSKTQRPFKNRRRVAVAPVLL
ncbi:hypothetical protein AeMF1_011949 [Aphanomyces euteiches]|nr:hypothetical protein AeMF1_011949 [Aphanomyces euteiches]